MPVAPQQASTLLGVAAAAAAPSLRLAVARSRLSPASVTTRSPNWSARVRRWLAVREAIVRAAASPFPVIIEGESGSGKELAARAIHGRSSAARPALLLRSTARRWSTTSSRPNCSGTRAAPSPAPTTDRPGLFEDASGGTLFLDEIAELGARVQAKLLRVLQEGEVRRVGETIVRKIDVRIVAATNRPLAAEVAADTFRADLWYRLDVVRITLPPLRERIEDLPLLTQHLWQALAARTGSRAALSPATIAALAAYDWPGNIRELQNVLASHARLGAACGIDRSSARCPRTSRGSRRSNVGATLSLARASNSKNATCVPRSAPVAAAALSSTAARDVWASAVRDSAS